MLNGNGIAAQRIGKVDEGIGDVIQSFCDNECFFGCNLLNCQCAAVGRGFRCGVYHILNRANHRAAVLQQGRNALPIGGRAKLFIDSGEGFLCCGNACLNCRRLLLRLCQLCINRVHVFIEILNVIIIFVIGLDKIIIFCKSAHLRHLLSALMIKRR